MRRHTVLALCFSLAAALLNAPARAQVGTYTLIDLGAPQATGINNNGQITGSGAPDSKGYSHGYRITPSTPSGPWFVDSNHDGNNDLIALLPFPGKGFVSNGANAINSTGSIAGITGNAFATLWSADLKTQIQFTSGTKNNSKAYGINDIGDVVGENYGSDSNIVHKGLLWELNNGSYTAVNILPVAPYSQTTGYGVNNSRQVVGALNGYMASLIWDSTGGTRTLFTVPGMVASIAYGINNAGQVAGYYSTGNEHAYLWLPAPAGTLPAGLNDIHDGSYWSSTDASGLNNPPAGDAPQVVGTGHTLNGAIRAFLWSNATGIRDLNALVTNLPTGWYLKVANAINDNGLIVGNAIDASGTSHGVVLTPNP